ncbi:MAG: hypothetical protein BWY57_01035 [Betaproteobacteria bacterium ADurb.Bin341]|nr:MAG: hypothetical protein BWY57_01035 [Betaproteobacteria bacterium ADurb.Bin341]
MSDDLTPETFDAARAALEPTLRAVADILPLVVQAREPRFPPELASRWQACCERLAQSWSERHCGGMADFRPAVFELCALAVELKDGDCLRLSEALASASDLLEDPQHRGEPRLLAALSAACEGLVIDNGLEHPLFSERVVHLTVRLNHCLQPATGSDAGNPLLLRIFVDEAQERLESMREALELLPPDAYAIKTAAKEMVHLAEPLELYDLIDRARLLIVRLTPLSGDLLDLDDPETRAHVLDRMDLLEAAVHEIAGML